MRWFWSGLLALSLTGCLGNVENENKVRLSGGVTVVQFPTADEGMGLTGMLTVDYDGMPPMGLPTVVTVNGVSVPEVAGMPGKYDVSKVTVPNIGPSAKIKIDVVIEEENDGYELTCPENVILNSPEDGATTMNGLMLNVGWIGTVDYGNGPTLQPTLSIYEYSPAPINRRFDITPPVSVMVTGISSPLTMPAAGPTMGTQFMIELAIPGPAIDLMRGAVCTLVRRVRLTKA